MEGLASKLWVESMVSTEGDVLLEVCLAFIVTVYSEGLFELANHDSAELCHRGVCVLLHYDLHDVFQIIVSLSQSHVHEDGFSKSLERVLSIEDSC